MDGPAMRLFVAILYLVPLISMAQVYGTFTWPSSNAGPYTLLSTGVTSFLVSAPDGNPITESGMATHRYQHHTRIYNLGNNPLGSNVIAIAYSSAFSNEADAGEQTGISFSTNRGTNWSAPLQVIPSQYPWINNMSNGVTIVGQRITYPRNFDTANGSNWLVSATDVYFDTSMHEVGVGLIACAVLTNQTIGPLILISTNNYPQTNGMPLVVPTYNSGMHDALMPNSIVYGRWGGRSQAYPTEWTHWWFDGDNNWVEPSTTSFNGSSTNLVRFWRCTGGTSNEVHLVGQTHSTDSGSTWSAITFSQVPNAPSETCIIRLTDGRFAILGNPRNSFGQGRDPLFLAVTDTNSTSVVTVNAIRQGLSGVPVYIGWSKNGGASYVDAVQLGNYLYVSYSIAKEEIWFSRVLIPGLADNNNDTNPPPAGFFSQSNSVSGRSTISGKVSF